MVITRGAPDFFVQGHVEIYCIYNQQYNIQNKAEYLVNITLNISFKKQMQNIKQMDQNNWVCYKFGENSYYYGQVGLLDQAGVVHSKDNTQLAADPKVKLVKNGFGIYIYDDQTGQARYQGTWSKDQKSGKGILRMKDGAVYQGGFKDGCYHDVGVLKWKNGDVYDGRWKKGRMEGPGIFKRHDGFTLKGSFKNNYFIDINTLRNPFMSEQEYQDLKKRRKQLIKQQQKNQKVKTGYFERTQLTPQTLTTLLTKSNNNNRVPLIVSSQQSQTTLTSLKQNLTHNSTPLYLIDLRKHYKLEGEQKYKYLKELESMTQKCMKEGGILLLSLDDGDVQEFQELFYPEVKELYTQAGFNSTTWAPADLRKDQVRKGMIGDAKLNQQFRFAVWSKIRLSSNLTNDFLREKLQKRFESVLPYIKIDIVFIDKKKQEEKPAQP